MGGKKLLSGHRRQVDVAVTKQLIAEALPRDSSHCMIADAVKLAVPTAKRVSVDLATIRFSDPAVRRRYIYLTPARAQAALLRFDQGEEVEPFKFRLGRAAQVVEMMASSTPAPGGKRAPTPSQTKKGVSTGKNQTPIVLGGKLPPNGALSNARGKVRQFGLKQLRP